MPSGFSLYSARSAAISTTVSAPSEEAAANRPADGTDGRHITSRRVIIECDSVRVITIREVYTKECITTITDLLPPAGPSLDPFQPKFFESKPIRYPRSLSLRQPATRLRVS